MCDRERQREKVEDISKRIRKTEIGHTDTDTYRNKNRNNWRLIQGKTGLR